MSTQLTVDFKAISHARLFYKNQFGESIRCKPTVPTVHGTIQLDPLRVALATKLGILDRWTCHCILQLRNNNSLQFVGKKAMSMFRNYNNHIFNGNK